MDVRKIVNQTVKIVLPLLLGGLLFWYLYREQDFGAMMDVIRGGVRYDILLFSLLFGLAANVTRGFRWGLLIDSADVFVGATSSLLSSATTPSIWPCRAWARSGAAV